MNCALYIRQHEITRYVGTWTQRCSKKFLCAFCCPVRTNSLINNLQYITFLSTKHYYHGRVPIFFHWQGCLASYKWPSNRTRNGSKCTKTGTKEKVDLQTMFFLHFYRNSEQMDVCWTNMKTKCDWGHICSKTGYSCRVIL